MFKIKPDRFNRAFEYLRVSVTDRCNFRCKYCMPKENFGSDYKFIARSEILTFEEIIRLVRILGETGLKKIRLTGGEPLVRKDFSDILKRLAKLPVKLSQRINIWAVEIIPPSIFISLRLYNDKKIYLIAAIFMLVLFNIIRLIKQEKTVRLLRSISNKLKMDTDKY